MRGFVLVFIVESRIRLQIPFEISVQPFNLATGLGVVNELGWSTDAQYQPGGFKKFNGQRFYGVC